MSDDKPWNFDDDDFYEIESKKEQIQFLLRYAVLAPSGHNMQPWRFEVTPLGVSVYPDYSRRLRAADPEDRELLMSLGAAIANLRVSAAHFGFESTLSVPDQPDQFDGPAALVSLRETCVQDPKLASLFSSIKLRRTNRHSFDGDTIEPQVLSPILDFIDDHPDTFHIVFRQEVHRAADLIAFADKMQMEDARYRAELAGLLRPAAEGATDGLPASAFGFPSSLRGAAPLIVRHVDLGAWQAYRDRDLAESAAMIVVVASDDDAASLIRTGEALELFLLTITKHGLQYSFLNAPVQLSALRDRVSTLSRTKRPPQLIIRIGPGRMLTTTTPRRPVSEVVT